MTATDAQVRIAMRERKKGKNQEQAAAKANRGIATGLDTSLGAGVLSLHPVEICTIHCYVYWRIGWVNGRDNDKLSTD